MDARLSLLSLPTWQLEALARALERRPGGRIGSRASARDRITRQLLLSGRSLPEVLAEAWRADRARLEAELADLRARVGPHGALADLLEGPADPARDWWGGVGVEVPLEAGDAAGGWWGGEADDDDERPEARSRPILVE